MENGSNFCIPWYASLQANTYMLVIFLFVFLFGEEIIIDQIMSKEVVAGLNERNKNLAY